MVIIIKEGVFKIKNYDIVKELRSLYPDITSDPNDCYFENIDLENATNQQTEKKFFHLIDLRLNLLLKNDNRFALDAPTITSVSPNCGSIKGGQTIQISGINLAINKFSIKEILIAGVVCKNVKIFSPNSISCDAGDATIIGETMGNVVIKRNDGMNSPTQTCNMFKYSDKSTPYKTTLVTGSYIRPSYVSIQSSSSAGSQPNVNTVATTALYDPSNMFYSPTQQPNNFSFRQVNPNNKKQNLQPKLPNMRMKQIFNQSGPSFNDIQYNLNQKLLAPPQDNHLVERVNTLVDDNFQFLKSQLTNSSFGKIKTDGLRKNRFSRIFNKLN